MQIQLVCQACFESIQKLQSILSFRRTADRSSKKPYKDIYVDLNLFVKHALNPFRNYNLGQHRSSKKPYKDNYMDSNLFIKQAMK